MMDNMKLDDAKKEIMEGDFMREKIGEMLYDFIQEDDNNTLEMGKSLMNVILGCEKQEQFDIVNQTVIAICGWSVERLFEKIRERDSNGYHWESTL